MTKPFLSIVTISYNQAHYLRQCVDSVLSQKDDDVEYIVVDPGSTDGSRDILEGYGSAITRLILEPDKGPADGLNKGFAHASGEVGYFINSDDFLLPGAVARMRRLWRENPAIEVLLGGAWMLDGDGLPRRELFATPVSMADLCSGRVSVVQQGMSFRLRSFARAGGFNDANGTCWDYELLCSFRNQNMAIKVSTERFGVFRIYSDSLSGGATGESHVRRYLADVERIHREMMGGMHQKKGVAVTPIRHLMQLIKTPRRSWPLIRDFLYPKGMRRRWQRDVGIAFDDI